MKCRRLSKRCEPRTHGCHFHLIGSNHARSTSSSADVEILSVLVPFPLEDGVPLNPPTYLASSSKMPIHLVTSYSKFSAQHAEGISWALQQGHVVDIDVQANIAEGEAGGWDGLEDLLDKSLKLGTTEERKGIVVLCTYNTSQSRCGHQTDPPSLANILPPPHSLTLPIVKLLTHPTYRAYQDRLATLSLFPNVRIKFLPPMWDAPTPSTPLPDATRTGDSDSKDSKEKKEWKRRIKMYRQSSLFVYFSCRPNIDTLVGPAVEAFGYQRIIFGSSPSPRVSPSASNAGDWYDLARESFTELGLEQADIDAVFCDNAKNVYGSS